MQSRGIKIIIAITRFVMAAQFLWAFFDKLLGLGFATAPEAAWIRGGSPTFGFLANGASGPFVKIFNFIAGKSLTDWLFMLALLLIGLVLLLGIGMKIGTISGSVLMFFMWAATLPKPNNIFQIDDHIINILVLIILLLLRAGQVAGLGRWWSGTRLVKKLPWLE